MATLNWFRTMTTTPKTFPRMQLNDVEGNEVNINMLVSKYNVILVTLKSVQCPICPQLLKILNMYGLDPKTDSYTDPYTMETLKVDKDLKRYYRLLLKYDTYFIILCPGTDAEVRDVQLKTPFLDYPFISTFGGANELVKTLKVQLSDQEFMPAMLQVNSSNLSVTTIYFGRGPGQYFQDYLFHVLEENRVKREKRGIICCRSIHQTIDQIKRRIIKCQNGKLGVTWIASSTTKLPVSSNSEDLHNNVNINLPPEILELIFSLLVDDIKSLVSTATACRLFYMSVCNVLIVRLRTEMEWLKSALPQNTNLILEETEYQPQSLDRWSAREEGVPLHELVQHITYTTKFITQIQTWTKNWRIRAINNVFSH